MFIVIEGIDSSGKKTQTNLLVKHLKSMGKKPEVLDFPTYNSPLGKIIGNHLSGRIKPKYRVTPELAAMMFAADRYQYKDELFGKMKKGKILIANRYVQSNIGYQGARFNGEARNSFLNWVNEVESRLPQADIVIYLDMPPQMARRLKGRRPKKKYPGQKDLFEQNPEYQKKVREMYLEAAEKEEWVVIDTTKGNRLRKPEEIHEEIWHKIKNKF
jgi:dTMP kinase